MCDSYLGERAGINLEPPEEIPAYLQVCTVCHAQVSKFTSGLLVNITLRFELAVAEAFMH